MNLVTGGAGFIGSHLVQHLLAQGEAVRVLERPGASVDHLPLRRLELARADIRDAGAVREAVDGCRRVYHLAADPNLWCRRRELFDAVNRGGTENVLNAALAAGAERVVYVSTESILTAPGFEGGAVETLRLREQDMIGPYCLSKFRAEQLAFRLADEGAPVLVAAPTLPVGPGDRLQTPPTRMAVAFCRGQLPAYLESRFNLIDVRDVAQGIWNVMRCGRPAIRYLIGHANRRLSEWLGLLGEAVGRAPPRYRVPYPVALAVAWLSECCADYLTGRMPLATVTGVRLTRRCMFFDPAPSLAELRLEPRPIEQSARDAVAWYREQGWLR